MEAFASGCPVVTSNLSSMKEISEGAAVLVDPYSVESIAGGIEKALNRNEQNIKKGHEIAKRYSWSKTAESTVSVYKEFLNI